MLKICTKKVKNKDLRDGNFGMREKYLDIRDY